MEKSKDFYSTYTKILKSELLTALGCTEPICIAYCSAVMRDALGAEPEKIQAFCSGNLIKNAKGATVPNSGGLKGISASAILGPFAYELGILKFRGGESDPCTALLERFLLDWYQDPGHLPRPRHLADKT